MYKLKYNLTLNTFSIIILNNKTMRLSKFITNFSLLISTILTEIKYIIQFPLLLLYKIFEC